MKKTKLYRAVVRIYCDLKQKADFKKTKMAEQKCFRKEYRGKLKKLKNIHQGKRCFIIGNGPSLRASDLDLLKNEITFAANSIFKIFDQTDWRPTYYCNSDIYVLGNIKDGEAFWSINADKYFFQLGSKRIMKKYPENSLLYRLLVRQNRDKTYKFSEDISNCIYDAETITYIMIQIAVYMGFKEIFLIGIDHAYSKTIDINGKKHYSNVKDHFFGESQYPDNIEDFPKTEIMEMGYKAAKDISRKLGCKIYNATRGGHLEVFDRTELEEALKRPNKQK